MRSPARTLTRQRPSNLRFGPDPVYESAPFGLRASVVGLTPGSSSGSKRNETWGPGAPRTVKVFGPGAAEAVVSFTPAPEALRPGSVAAVLETGGDSVPSSAAVASATAARAS